MILKNSRVKSYQTVLNHRFQQIVKKVDSFSNLSNGWHYGQGVPPLTQVIDKAKKLNDLALRIGFKETNAFPGIDGEVQITAYFKNLYLEFTIPSDGLITYVYERDHQEIEYEQITYDEAITKIKSFRGLIWALSELLVRSTSIPKRNASKVSPLNHLAQMAGSQSSIKSVPFKLVETSVPIYKSFTPKSQETLQYFGKSLKVSSLPIFQ
jgi:hypothetical protein